MPKYPFISASNEHNHAMHGIADALASIWRMTRGSNTPQLCCVAILIPRQLAAGCLIEQNDETECGAVCMAMVCRYYKKNISVLQMRKLTRVDERGTNMMELCNAAEKLGCQAEGLKGDIQELIKEDPHTPFIAHIIADKAYEHFVVVYKIDSKTVVMADPAQGILNLGIDEFAQLWTGRILTLVPTERFHKDKGIIGNNPLVPFLKDFLKNKKLSSSVLILSVIVTLLNVSMNAFFYIFMDYVIPYNMVSVLIGCTVVIIIVYIMAAALNWLRSYFIARLSKDLNLRILRKYISKALKADYGLHQHMTDGDFIARLQDIDIVQDAVSQIVTTLFLDAFMIVIGILFLCDVNLSLCIVSCIVLLLYAATVGIFNKPISKISHKLRKSSSEMTSAFLESVNGIEIIKAYNIEEAIEEKNGEKILKLIALYKKGTIVFSSQSSLSGLIMSVSEIILLSLGGWLIIRGKMTLGEVMMSFSVFRICLSPCRNVIDLIPVMHKAKASAERIAHILDFDSEDDGETDDIASGGDVVFDNVAYRYGRGDLILKDFSLHIKRGEKIALVGGSGSGKSTLVKLLLCYFAPESGDILIGNNSIYDSTPSIVRKYIAYVPQNCFLFSGSILENLKYGNSDLSDDEIVEKLHESPLGEYIDMLPNGFHALVTEHGNNLSGGQKQIISIARALLKGADIIIMDEGTSNLDAFTESMVLKILLSLENVTCIIIAHRLNENTNPPAMLGRIE